MNLSLGGGKYSSHCDGQSNYTGTFADLNSLGIAVVVASGNQGYTDGIHSPACVSSAISVGAVKDTTDEAWVWTNSAPILDILAPGSWITAAEPGGGYYGSSGTHGIGKQFC